MSGKRIAPVAILAAGVLLVALIYATRPRVTARPPEQSAPLVQVERVETRAVRFSVRTFGTVAPRSETELVPQVSGEVVWVSPSLVSGGFFAAGDPLVRMDRSDYEVELETARATVARARSEHARAGRELQRQERLAERDVVSEVRMDEVRSQFQVAEAVLREARARLLRAERDLDRTELRAPYAGRVREEGVDPGQFVARGSSMAKLYAVDWAEVRLPVPDRELRFIDAPLLTGAAGDGDEPGPEVRLRAEFAGRPHEWRGHIVRSEGELDPKSRMVHLVARVEDPYGLSGGGDRPPLAVGLFVEAEILGRRVEGAVVLPRAALHRVPEGDAVLVLDPEGRLRFRPVELLRARRDDVVLGGGLAEGERVCVSPLPAAVDGMVVRAAGDGGNSPTATPAGLTGAAS